MTTERSLTACCHPGSRSHLAALSVGAGEVRRYDTVANGRFVQLDVDASGWESLPSEEGDERIEAGAYSRDGLKRFRLPDGRVVTWGRGGPSDATVVTVHDAE